MKIAMDKLKETKTELEETESEMNTVTNINNCMDKQI